MLNHVIKNEEGELEALLLTTAEASWDDLVAETRNKTCNRLSVSLEEGTHELSSCDLQIKFVGVLLLEQSHIISIESVILIFDLLIRKRQVLSNSFEGLVDNVNRLFA